jgi:hypothetical protein
MWRRAIILQDSIFSKLLLAFWAESRKGINVPR